MPPTAIAAKPIESRFVFWFNGNGIPERYWIPTETGADFRLSPCLSPLAPFRNDIHVLSGLDNQAATARGPGNGHHKAISGVTTCTPFTGHGAGRTVDRSGDRGEDRHANRASARFRSASRRNRSARASSAI